MLGAPRRPPNRLRRLGQKPTWSQKKYRASDKAKKPYYLRLTKQSREKLAWLAAHHERKDTEILEELIEGRYRDESSRKSAK